MLNPTCEHEVFVQQRGGGAKLAQLPYADMNYGSTLDQTSISNIRVNVGDADSECCEILSQLTAWKHEILITRDGQEAWVGPVTEPEWGHDYVQIEARDLSTWFEVRKFPRRRNFYAQDIAEIFLEMAQEALLNDSSPNIVFSTTLSGIEGSRAVDPGKQQIVADALRELSRTGVEWTMVGRTMFISGMENTRTLMGFTNDTLEISPVQGRGLNAISELTVVGSTPPGTDEPLSATVGGFSSEIGLVQRVITEPKILDFSSLLENANTRFETLREFPVFVRGKLLPGAPEWRLFVPGVRAVLDVDTGCSPVIQGRYRLVQMNTTSQVSDDAENITTEVFFAPLGRFDETVA